MKDFFLKPDFDGDGASVDEEDEVREGPSKAQKTQNNQTVPAT